MGDGYKSTRIHREEDVENGPRGTITRYKVSSKSGDRVDRIEVEDDTRSRFSSNGRRISNDIIERERSRNLVETRDTDRDWDRRTQPDDHRVERRVEESIEDTRGPGIERYRRETEYYIPAEPTPPPIIIRQQAPEPQMIIVQEAPEYNNVYYNRDHQESGPLVLSDREVDRQLMRRGGHEDDYYYRHEHRDLVPAGPYREDPYYRDSHARDRDWAMTRHDGRRREQYYSEDEDYYVSNRRHRPSRHRRHRHRSRSRSQSADDHRFHLAEGALAGAGVTALLQSKRDQYGDLPDNRGRKVIAGAALGALGTEMLTRAHGAYDEYLRDGRESPDRHSRLKTGFGIAAVAIAAAGAAKYLQTNKIEKEEAHRGRSRMRGYVSDGYYQSASRSHSRSRSRSRPRPRTPRAKSRRRSISTMAKTALGTVATAGVLRHLHNRSKSRTRSRSRSQSRLRTGAKIASAAAAAGVAGKLYKDHKEKKERSRSRGPNDAEDKHSQRRRDTSHSRSRSIARSLHTDAGADKQLDLYEYGVGPVPPAGQAYESDSDRPRRHSSRRHRRSPSPPVLDEEGKRSRSHLRSMADAQGTALGIKEYKDRKDREKRQRKPRDRSRGGDDYDDSHGRKEPRNDRPSSPPHASGGAYYPPYPMTPGANDVYDSTGNPAAAQPREYQPYIPQDYMGYVPPPPPQPPPGPPPAPAPGPMTGYPPEQPGLPRHSSSPDAARSGSRPGPNMEHGDPSELLL